MQLGNPTQDLRCILELPSLLPQLADYKVHDPSARLYSSLVGDLTWGVPYSNLAVV